MTVPEPVSTSVFEFVITFVKDESSNSVIDATISTSVNSIPSRPACDTVGGLSTIGVNMSSVTNVFVVDTVVDARDG